MKKRYKILIGLAVILVAFRLYLPYGVTKYINKTLAELPGYTGSISDVDIHLFRGGYVIDSLKIMKEDSSVTIPFFFANRIDLSIQWNALFKGSIVGEIDIIEADLNFVGAKDTAQTQYGEDVNWTQPIKDLIPVKIDRLGVKNSRIFFNNFQTEPQVELYLKDFNLEATNLTNASSDETKLPSKLTASATSIGDGKLEVTGDLNLLKNIPDVDIDLKFEQVKLPALNDFLMAYVKIDAEKGVFNLYSEIIIEDSQLNGYVKPLITDLKIVSWSKDKKKPLKLLWELVAGLVLELFENQSKDQFATKVPFKGDLSNPKTKIFPAIWNVFSNAFVKAFDHDTDGTLGIKGQN
jgi:hypothetical protein